MYNFDYTDCQTLTTDKVAAFITAEILHRFTLSRDRQIPALRDEICPQTGSLDGDLAIPFEHKLMGNFCRAVLALGFLDKESDHS
jgi:hypothetical protein